MSKYQTEKRKNKELRIIILSKEEAMKLQIKEYAIIKRKLDMIIHWLGNHTGIAPASLESHMKNIDRVLIKTFKNEKSNIIN